MKKFTWAFIVVLLTIFVTACGSDSNDNTGEAEPKTLDVQFDLPETADVNETVKLKATVTYGDDKVTDADEVEFEYWKEGNKDNSTMLEATNHEDGTYTADVSFDQDGVYEIFAHTSARKLHTMPKKTITVGEGSSQETPNNNED